MKYENIKEAIFISRPNRFSAEVEVDGGTELIHVKNTGRCMELLIPGTTVFLEPAAASANRKTRYSLICVLKNGLPVNLDSQAPGRLVEEWLRSDLLLPGMDRPAEQVRREVVYRSSRLDFAFETGRKQAYVEVKGVTLERSGAAMFPDAPTERGVKHIHDLTDAVRHGHKAYLIFVIQMRGVRYLVPNYHTHPVFGEALARAKKAGVHVLAYDCMVQPDEIRLNEKVAVMTGREWLPEH